MRGARFAATAAVASLIFQPVAASSGVPQAATAPASDIAAATAEAQAIDGSSKPAESEAAWKKVIALQYAQAKPDIAAIVLAHNRIGDTYYYRGRPDLAQKQLEGARDLLQNAGMGESDIMSETLSNLGTMHTAQGHAEKDIEIQARALAIRVKLYGPDDNRLAINYYNTGYALYEGGFPDEAATNIERGTRMRLATMKPDNPDLFLTLATAAGIIEASGRMKVSIEFAQKAVELVARYHPKHPYAGFVRGVLGKTLVAAGRAAEGAEVTREAVDQLAATMGKTNPLTLDAIANLSVSKARMGKFGEAYALMLESLPEQRQGPPTDIVRALISASNYAAEDAREDEAIKLGEEVHALAKTKLAPEHALRAQADYTLAIHLERKGEIARALELMQGADAIYTKRDAPGTPRPLAAQIYLGGLEISNGRRDAGYARVVAAAEKLAPRMFAIAEDPELGNSNNSYYEAFARAAEAAVQMEQPEDVFRYYQLATWDVNAQASQQVAMRAAAGRSSAAAAKVRALQDASALLRALHTQKAALLARGRVANLADVDKSLAATEAQVAQLRRELEAAVPGFDRLTRPAIVPLKDVQARLAPGEGLFLAMPSRSRTTLMIIRRDQVHVFNSPSPRSAMRKLVATVRGSIDAALTSGGDSPPAFDLAASHALYQALFPGEIGKALAPVKKLHVAVTDALASLPFALLVTRAPGKGADAMRRARWLIRDTSIDVPVTMASVGQARAAGASTSFIGVGAPNLSGPPEAQLQLTGLYRGGEADVRAIRGLPALPRASIELAAMRVALGAANSVLLTGDDANEARIKAMDLSHTSVLAFATHGLIAGEVDGLEEPALVMTPPAAPTGGNDGMLVASEVAELRLNADWVILSACNTAAGSTQAAPSYTGLAHAFLYAGGRSLLLSHWKVRDDAAARLAVDTVRGAASGLDRAEALRRATLSLISDRKVPGAAHPAIWAPLILIGQ